MRAMTEQTFPLETHFKVEVVSKSLEQSFSKETLEMVEREWSKELQKRPLFNGKIFDVLSATSQKIVGRFVDYKTYLAQLRNPKLRQQIPLHVLGVTGITSWKDYFLIARREKDVTLYPSFYEFAPAGGIDELSAEQGFVNIHKQVLIELQEEVGITPAFVQTIIPWKLITSKGDYELVVKIVLDPFQLQKQTFPNQEYSECFWLKASEVRNFAKKNQSAFVPLSFQIMDSLGV